MMLSQCSINLLDLTFFSHLFIAICRAHDVENVKSEALWLLCDEDDTPALRQPLLRTAFLQSILSFARHDAWWTVRFMSSQSSVMLSSHHFLGLPRGNRPCVYPSSKICGYCPFLCESRAQTRSVCNTSLISLLHLNCLNMSTFRLLSLLVIPQAYLSQDCHLKCFQLSLLVFLVQVSELFKQSTEPVIDIEELLLTLLSRPILLSTSLQQKPSWVITPPRYTNSPHCGTSVPPIIS